MFGRAALCIWVVGRQWMPWAVNITGKVRIYDLEVLPDFAGKRKEGMLFGVNHGEKRGEIAFWSERLGKERRDCFLDSNTEKKEEIICFELATKKGDDRIFL